MAIPPQLLEVIRDTEPLSESASRLLALMGDGTHSLADVTHIATTDAKLALRILRTVNSAAFGLRSQVDSLERAVAYLGDKTVLGIAMHMGADRLYKKELPGYMAEGGALWRHSLYVAVACRELAKHTADAVSPDVAYTAGLLHDIGKSLLDSFLLSPESRIAMSTEPPSHGVPTPEAADGGDDRMDFDALERAQVETDHAEVGAALLEAWGLPGSLRAAVAHHHAPSEAAEKDRPLVYVVHLGDFLSMMGGTGTGMDALRYTLDAAYGEVIHLLPRELDRIQFDVQQECAKTLQALEGGV